MPRYLLIASAGRGDAAALWQFRLQSVDGLDEVEACDAEPGADQDRAELWAVVRGLEALAQPSQVLLTCTRPQVYRGLTRTLLSKQPGAADEPAEWLLDAPNADLWDRVRNALRYHRCRCRLGVASRNGSPRWEGAGGMAFRRWRARIRTWTYRVAAAVAIPWWRGARGPDLLQGHAAA